MAKYISTVRECREKIVSGGLVAFPTETVYGLGGNAFDPNAIASIFETKGRPANDPLIVHLPFWEKARDLLVLNKLQNEMFIILANKYWPGPLTMVGPAIKKIPDSVTSGTGWVGVRCPDHPVAQKFLRECDLPIAAPSANRFSHVSPTTPEHVMKDLGEHAIFILRCGDDKPCDCGVESTVIRLEEDGSLTILRRGAISEFDIRQIVEVKVAENILSKTQKYDAPGMMLKHYAPDGLEVTLVKADISDILLKNYGILDFGGILRTYRQNAVWYYDLSERGDTKEACQNLFSKLREAEDKNMDRLFLPYLVNSECAESSLHNTLADKFYRASGGKF